MWRCVQLVRQLDDNRYHDENNWCVVHKSGRKQDGEHQSRNGQFGPVFGYLNC